MSIEECEATVVAGNVPEAPPVPPKPATPVGTPFIQPLQLSRRPRHNRKSPALRASFQETSISPANFVYPLFIHEGQEDTPIGAMLGWRHGLVVEVAKARDVGVNSIVLFPKVPDALKIHIPQMGMMVSSEKMARAGADVVSPSDMMDGRVGAIRATLDAEGFHHVSIMSYTAKNYSQLFSWVKSVVTVSDIFSGITDMRVHFMVRFEKHWTSIHVLEIKKRMNSLTCMMNPANYREALVEAHEDDAEGADILLVKPGLPYLDIIRLLRDQSPLPIAADQVSGTENVNPKLDEVFYNAI
ncbi:hypothetical protein CRYUN_Cryun28dG0039700 [Craigia yunnanensis]